MRQVKLYFLRNSLNSTIELIDDLAVYGIPREHIRVFARDYALQSKVGINGASLFETTDLTNALFRGLVVGFLVGIILSIICIYILFQDLNLGVFSALIITLICALYGAWVSSMVGIGLPSAVLLKYEQDLAKGKYLLFVTIPKERELDLERKFRLEKLA